MSPIAGPLSRLLHPTAADSRPDGELLAVFYQDRDETAFAELVRRHGPVVRSACRRVLPDPADADDAFQAAFLVLVRRGAKLDPTHPLGPWLYRVAVLTARTLRRGNARRFVHLEQPPADLPAPAAPTDLRLDLDAALLALPEKYRTPLVLCHLQGWSRRDAAERLGCREGTLSSLLARGLVKLKDRLRGYDPTAALAAGAVPVPLALAAATARAAVGVGRSAAAVRAAGEVVRGFWLARLTAAAGAVAVLVAAGFGAAACLRQPTPTPVTAAAVTPLPERPPEPRRLPLPPAVPPVRIDVQVGGPLNGYRLQATEVGPGENPLGDPVCLNGIDRFQHYLAAARSAHPSPPPLRVDVWDEAPPTRTRAVFRAVGAAGYRSVNVRGRVPTVNPGGWQEYDGESVEVTDVAPPEDKAVGGKGGGGGKAGGCNPKPVPCRTPAMEP
ncbi:MAG TPA: sigma-70 family RNA polymerase sigma factor [Urbifossiella sp.]|nr:sigma-70 family RNA polymerase sigma factor [Urbifossiella sp.]